MTTTTKNPNTGTHADWVNVGTTVTVRVSGAYFGDKPTEHLGTVVRQTETQIIVNVPSLATGRENGDVRFKYQGGMFSPYVQVGHYGNRQHVNLEVPQAVQDAMQAAAAKATDDKRTRQTEQAARRTADMAHVRDLLGDAAPWWVKGDAKPHNDLSGVNGGEHYGKFTATELAALLDAAIANDRANR